MGLIYRNGRPYLYRSVRRDGRVTSEYIASGEAAVLLARSDARERQEREDRLAADRAGLLAEEDIESALETYFDRVENLAWSFLFAAGFHRPTREWRRRHVRRPER